jgi:hypothetical protein
VNTFEDPSQWTVGQLRAELVGLPDDVPVFVYVQEHVGLTVTIRQVLTGAGFGPDVDPEDMLLTGEFPLTARYASDADTPSPRTHRRH